MPKSPTEMSELIGGSCRALSCSVLLSSVLWVGNAFSDGTPSESSTNVTHRDGVLTVVAIDARVSEILEEIGRESGINISLLGKFDERITRTMVDTPVADAIKRLIPDGVSVIIYDQARAAQPVRQIQEVWLYRRVSGPVSTVVITQKSATQTLESSAAVESEAQGTDSDLKVRRQVAELSELSKSARMAMVRRLALRDDSMAIAMLGEILKTDRDIDVRKQAVKALGDIGDERVVVSLEKGLGDPQVWIRMEVVHAIGTIGGDHSVRDLGQVIFGEEDAEVRRLATEYLAQNQTEAAQAFLEAASNDRNEIVRETARRALGLD